MGTRGAWGYRKNNEDKITYNHSDSYPSALGKEIVDFVNRHTIEEHKVIYDWIVLVDETKKPTEEEFAHIKKIIPEFKNNKNNLDWYSVLRIAQYEPEYYARGLRYMINSNDFLKNSLFCEWAYIINLDENVLEIYKGFNKNPNAKGRYAKEQSCTDPEYYGVALIKKLSFEHGTKIKMPDILMKY